MGKHHKVSLAVGLMCASSALMAIPASAQSSSSAEKERESIEQLDEQLTAPSTTSEGGRLRPAARIVGGSDDTSAQITFSTHSEGRSSPSTTDFAITLTAPLDEDTGRADFLTVDGLPSQWSVGLSLSISLVDFDGVNQRFAQRGKLLEKALQNCLRTEAKPTLTADQLAAKCDLMESQVGDYLDPAELQDLNAARGTVYDALERKSFSVINIAGAVGTQEFEYFDSTTLGKSAERKYSYSGSIWFGHLPSIKSKVFLIGGFEAKRSFSDATKATYCPTGSATPTVKCTTGPFGPPKEETDFKISGKVRYRFSGSAGLEVSTAYDFKDKSWGVEVPVYFIVDKEGGLTGGIRAAYDSKEKDVQFGIFIGQTFGFLKL